MPGPSDAVDATTTRVSSPARRAFNWCQARRSWAPMEPETPTSRWMLARGTPALRSCNSWEAGFMPGTLSWRCRLVRMYPKSEAMPGVYVYGTLPATGKCSSSRGVPYSPFVERGLYHGVTVLCPSSLAFFSGGGQMRLSPHVALRGSTLVSYTQQSTPMAGSRAVRRRPTIVAMQAGKAHGVAGRPGGGQTDIGVGRPAPGSDVRGRAQR